MIKDSIRYAYDEMGNITKVYENGELAARYKYDKNQITIVNLLKIF